MRPDTVVVDTALAVPDSLPPPIGSDTLAVADSLAPPERLPSLPDPVGRTALPGVHVWERADLFRSGAVTLGELLARTPGVQALDIGYYAAPQALAGFAAGAGAGAVEVVLDGYPLDPLVGAAIDIARLPLVQLERVRLERRADRIRVELETVRPIDPRPYTVVEAQAGEPFDVATFRGLFVAPNFVRGPLAVAFERVGSDGVDGAEPADLTNMWLRWSLVSDSQGVQLEFLNSETGWSGELPFTGEETRRDLIVRARSARLLPGAVIELHGGTSWLAEQDPAPDQAPPASVEAAARSSLFGARLGWATGRSWARLSGRWRRADRLPDLELRAEAGIRPLPWFEVAGDVDWERWPDAESASALRLTAAVEPFLGLRAFGSFLTGSIGARGRDSEAGPIFMDRTGIRLGLGWEGAGSRVEVVGVALDADSVRALGPPFDSLGATFPAGELRGFEASGSIPLFRDLIRVEASYLRWQDAPLRPYMPGDEGRAALVLHTLPLESGNLEILARAEVERVGGALVPSLGGATLEVVPARTLYHAYLHIRIVTVRAFLRLENLRGTPVADFPGRTLPRARVLYGVKWELFN